MNRRRVFVRLDQARSQLARWLMERHGYTRVEASSHILVCVISPMCSALLQNSDDPQKTYVGYFNEALREFLELGFDYREAQSLCEEVVALIEKELSMHLPELNDERLAPRYSYAVAHNGVLLEFF